MTAIKIKALLLMSIGFILVACGNGEADRKQLEVEDYADIFCGHQQAFQDAANGLLMSGEEGRITYNGNEVFFGTESFTEVFSQDDADQLHNSIIEIFKLGIISGIQCNSNSVEFGIIYPDSDVTFIYHYSRDAKLTAHIVKTLDNEGYWSLVFIPHV